VKAPAVLARDLDDDMPGNFLLEGDARRELVDVPDGVRAGWAGDGIPLDREVLEVNACDVHGRRQAVQADDLLHVRADIRKERIHVPA